MKLSLLACALTQFDWHSAMKRRLEHREIPQMYEYRGTAMSKRQQEGRHLKAKERVLRRNQLCWWLDLGLWVYRTVGNRVLSFKPPSMSYFVTAALAKLCSTHGCLLYILNILSTFTKSNMSVIGLQTPDCYTYQEKLLACRSWSFMLLQKPDSLREF